MCSRQNVFNLNVFADQAGHDDLNNSKMRRFGIYSLLINHKYGFKNIEISVE